MLCHKIADCSILYTYDKITLSTRLIYSSVLHTFKPKLQSKRKENTIFSKRQQCSYGNGGTLNVPSIMILSTLISRINQRQNIWPKNCRTTSGNQIFENFISQKEFKTGSKWISVSPLNVPSILSYSSIENQPKAKLFGQSWRI